MVKTKVKLLVNEVNYLSTENKSDENKPNDRPDVSSDEGLTLDTSALKLLTAANLRYQLSW